MSLEVHFNLFLRILAYESVKKSIGKFFPIKAKIRRYSGFSSKIDKIGRFLPPFWGIMPPTGKKYQILCHQKKFFTWGHSRVTIDKLQNLLHRAS